MKIRHRIKFLAALVPAVVLIAPSPAAAQREMREAPAQREQREPPVQREMREVQAQRELREPPAQEARTAGNPLETFKRFETAWRSGNAAGIVALVGEGRVYIDVRGIGRQGGWFTRPQILFLLRNMFEKDTQTRFEFIKYHNLDKPDRKVFGIAYRSFKNNRSGNVVHDKVYVTLGREGSAWVVSEIKTTR